jgi:dUTP pyrophosphatase
LNLTLLAFTSTVNTITVRIARIGHHQLPLPSYATEGSSGMDLRSSVECTLNAGETGLISTGFALEIPAGYEGQVRPRSGLAAKHQIGVMNSPGTIDSDYRGEVKIILTNFGNSVFDIKVGDRIAQLVVAPVVKAVWHEVDAVDETGRGSGGFGHTGRQ